MVRLILTERLNRRCLVPGRRQRLLTTRRLSDREVALGARYGLRRYYRPSLEPLEVDAFFQEFARFWDEVVQPFGPTHPFWRNAVSSKMQEWDQSAGYLALTLFALLKPRGPNPIDLIVICDGLEEVALWVAWGKRHGWDVEERFWCRGPAWMRRIVQETKNVAKFVYFLCVAFGQKWAARNTAAAGGSGRPRVLIASSFYVESFQHGRYQDPFFGRLHTVIAEHYGEVAYLNVPLSRMGRGWARCALGTAEVPIHVPHAVVGWAELLMLALRVFWRRLPIARSHFKGCDFAPTLKWHARRFSNGFSLGAELYYAATRRLCRVYRFERLICNFEGNAFERGCFQAFRESLGETVVGYSQGVLFPANLKLRLDAAEVPNKPEPDWYVCTGPYAMDLLATLGARSRAKLLPGCTLRGIPEQRPEHDGRRPRWILVALDGVWGTVAVLDWLFEHADVLGGRRVRLRAHPNVPLWRLLQRTLLPKPNTFEVSDGDLRTDIEGSLCVLYRHTSVGMQALLNGVPVVHLAIDSPLPSDPIEGLRAGKWIARDARELGAALKEIRTQDPRRRTADMATAGRFVRNYFAAPTRMAMADFLR